MGDARPRRREEQQGKLAKPLDLNAFFYPELMRKVQPTKVNYKP